MKTSTFEFGHIDESDIEQMEQAWNAWARDLHTAGFALGEEPVRWTNDSVTYELIQLAESEVA